VPIWRTTLKKLNFLSSVILLSTTSAIHAEQLTLAPVLVSANKTETTDISATYASEVYVENDIKSSGANTLYSFLSQNTSVNVTSSFGNLYSQKIDFRGYGLGDGYENIAVTLNGRRLNQIDGVPQLLGAIPLNSIERIEITKGTGSVVYGDNATAGSIQIYTKEAVSHNIGVSFGNKNQKTANFSTGYNHDYFTVRAHGTHDETDGFKDEDTTGFTNESSNSNTSVALDIFPTENIKLSLGRDHTIIDTRYTGSQTLEQFKNAPEQRPSSPYTRQKVHSDVDSLGADIKLNNNWNIEFNHSQEDKVSAFASSSNYTADYVYRSNEVLLKYKSDSFNIISGSQHFDGERASSSTFGSSIVSKENTGYFIQGEYFFNDMTFSLGGRKEKVDYEHSSGLKDHHNLSSYDIGFNQRINNKFSWFTNYNSSFQAPSVDRFFSGGTFNAFIEPAKAKTINIGLNFVTNSDKTKLTFFRADLDNEIYYYNTGSFSTSFNTNIDESHKYGVELQNRHQFNQQWLTTFTYAYTRAVIDKENEAAGAYDGKDLPGVPRHSITVAAHYTPTNSSTFVLSHSFRNTAYALNDFENNFSQKQPTYQSTDLAYSYNYQNLTLSINVQNIFDQENGILVGVDNIYPVNFARSYNFGVNYQF
jgi:iron complex outermembrane receptor protein